MTREIDSVLSHCRLCGHACGADRLSGRTGRCGLGPDPVVSAALLHHGEEPPISGTRGSGAIFFAGCPLSCVFCQNYQISQSVRGRAVSIDGLADWMIDLEQQGAHNVNLVSPTPWAVHVAGAIETARKRGLVVPVVYNTGGYDSLEALERLQGLVDVYLPDVKYATDRPARIYSAAEDYVQVNRRAVLEMDRQVGPLRLDERGIAVRGSIVRHLILPRGLADTDLVLAWIVDRLGPDAFVSLMAQYKPWHHVVTEPVRYCELNRPLTEREYETALETAAVLGMENLFVQELTSADVYLPDFDRADVFSRTR